MAEKKTTTTKKKVQEPTKAVITEKALDLIPTKVYKLIANGKGGLKLDRVYKVSGRVAAALVQRGLGKIID